MPGILTRWRTLFRPMVYNISFGPDAPAQVLIGGPAIYVRFSDAQHVQVRTVEYQYFHSSHLLSIMRAASLGDDPQGTISSAVLR